MNDTKSIPTPVKNYTHRISTNYSKCSFFGGNFLGQTTTTQKSYNLTCMNNPFLAEGLSKDLSFA